MSASKKSRRTRRSYYRAASPKRTIQIDQAVLEADIAADASEQQPANDVTAFEPAEDAAEDENSTQPSEAVADADDASPITDTPTIVLTPEQTAALSEASVSHIAATSREIEEGYAYQPPVDPADAGENEEPYDAPTIVLDVAALMATPPPPLAPASLPPTVSRPRSDAITNLPQPIARPRPPQSWPTPPPHRAPPLHDPETEFARLRAERLAREDGQAQPDEHAITKTLQQWWRDLRPGIDRVLGRAHRGGARAVSFHTSTQLPAVRMRSFDSDQAPAVQRLSETARQIGTRAQTAAMPALTKLHGRAERAAQALVDKIDERLGGRPPLQHVLLGPGRMIVAFASHVSIRDAQLVITSVQGRALRRLVGYNAYLVLVPPGREAIYAERLHVYPEVTGVHFGPQRPSGNNASSSTGRLAPGR
jgi:hypothetical protein